MATDKKFRIGLCMAGAVSAGAYTAGVIDYLLEALSEWENRKKDINDTSVPRHQVTIPVIGGASAGGMTALLTASTINNKITPVTLPDKKDLYRPHPENKLYNSWVDLLQDDMLPLLLDTSDIKNNVISALNSKFIEEIANKKISSDTTKWAPTPPYFEAPVKVFTTLTNLEGFCYYTGFAGSRKQKYFMSVHNDYACFEVADGVTEPSGAPWMPLDFRTGDYLDTARDAAMATGAFPIGLQPRRLKRKKEYVEKIPWLEYVFTNTPLTTDVVETLNIDGGMINNEPFEKVRDLLNKSVIEKIISEKYDPEKISKEEYRVIEDIVNIAKCKYETLENTVLMIDPFPSVQAEPFVIDESITSIIPSTISAMLSQMRAKPTEYKNAMVDDDPSQFIISPSRKIINLAGKEEDINGEKAIACGNLSGFGGFISKEFRIHDYYLGRYNCEIFLRDYFTIPEAVISDKQEFSTTDKNGIFYEGYKNTTNKSKFESRVKKGHYQIIPIFTEAPAENTLKMPVFSCGENWPRQSETEIDRFKKPLKKRVEKLLLNTANLPPAFRLFIQIGAKLAINNRIANKTLETIKNSLYKWSLLKDYKPEKKSKTN